MTEKIGLIKNPLTIIAIFAGIAEVSGTIVLPFVSETNQELFIIFLICFPSILVVLFFITLNFNNKVLYAPSDYKDETNYIKINKYDVSKQRTIEVKVPVEDSKNQHLIQLTEKIEYLNAQIIRVESSLSQKDETVTSVDSILETIGHKFLVSTFENVDTFIISMKRFGVNFEVYHSPGEPFEFSSFNEHRAIWLGENVDIKLAQVIIKHSKQFYPHLRYIQLSYFDGMDYDKQIYIGGSTKSAIEFNCIPLKDSDFNQMETFSDKSTFHAFINQFNK